jgi:hypothetical protein
MEKRGRIRHYYGEVSMKARVFPVIAALAAICCTSCPSSTSYNPQRRGEYTLGTHSFYYTIIGATTTTAEVAVTNAVGGGDDLGIVAFPYTTPTYTVTLSGSAMRADISGTAIDAAAISITVYIYEDGTVLASQAFSGNASVPFDLGAFL